MEWSLVLAELEPRVRQEVEAIADTIRLLRQEIARLEALNGTLRRVRDAEEEAVGQLANVDAGRAEG